MNTNNFDLNIKNYKREELKNMFNLPDNYDEQMIDTMEARFKNGILSNKKVSDETKSKTLFFLTEAKKVLREQVMNFEDNVKSVLKATSNYTLIPTPLESNSEHMVQARDPKPYFRSLPREYFEGVINPIVRTTIHQSLNIDTRFRDNYYGSSSSNFSMTIPFQLSNILNMQLVAIELPTTFLTISKQLGNNFFTVSIEDATTISAVVIVPDGNYTNDGIVNMLNTLVTNISTEPGLSLFQYILFGINLTNGNGSGQMFVGLDSTAPGTITSFSMNFQADLAGKEDKSTPLPLKLGWILGFRNGIYENNINYVSEGAVDLIGPRYLYLVVDDYNNNVNNSFYSAFNSSILNKNILARISVQTTAFSVVSENNLNVVTLPREYFGPVNIQKMTIQLLDEYGRIVDLNNMDFSFCLTFTTVYDL